MNKKQLVELAIGLLQICLVEDEPRVHPLKGRPLSMKHRRNIAAGIRARKLTAKKASKHGKRRASQSKD